LLGITGVAVLAGIFLYVFNVLWVSPVASEVVKQLLNSSSKKYIVAYENFQLNSQLNEINVNNIRIKYDTTQFADDDSTRLFFGLEMNRLSLAVNSITEVAYDKSLTVKHAILESPKINLYLDTEKEKGKRKNKKINSWVQAYQFISEYLHSLQVHSFSIRNASFNTYELRENELVPTFQLDSISTSFSYLALDSASFVNKNIVENIEDFSLELINYEEVLPDSLYKIVIGNLQIDKKTATLQLADVKLVPMYDRYAFAQQVGYRKGRITLEIPTLTFTGIDFDRMVSQQAFVCENLNVESLSLDIFSDKHMDEYKRYRMMIPEMLQSIPLDFKIDTLSVVNGELTYNERSKGSEDIGGVFFLNMYATLYNTTNIAEERENTMVADVKTKFMGVADLDVHFRFPLFRDDLMHTIQGSMTAMPLTDLNGILESALSASVKSGQLDKLDFTMELNQHEASGSMCFAYNNLKIELLSNESDDPKFKEKLGSFLANLVILKADNPSGKQDLREGTIAFERVKEKPVFGYWVNSLVSGVTVTLGVDKILDVLARINEEEETN